MARKTLFERLVPSEQVAIETQLQKVKKEELENCWKEKKAEETRDKRTGAGLILFIILMVIVMFYIVFWPVFQQQILQDYIRAMGPVICKAGNGTYVSTSFSSITMNPTTICSNFSWRIR